MTTATTRQREGTAPIPHRRDAIALSVAALRAARLGDGREEFEALAALSEAGLRAALPSDREKLAFWMNVYNAGIQRELRDDPHQYRRRFRFFARRGVQVAGRKLTFNSIEHGLLRRSTLGYSLGYISNPFPGRFERQHQLQQPDLRVHFALNCGAASCPPIAAYHPEAIDAELDLSTHGYLESETRFDAGSNVVTVPRIFFWFRGDFGGPPGTRDLLRRFGIIPPDANPRLRYGDFDWSLALP